MLYLRSLLFKYHAFLFALLVSIILFGCARPVTYPTLNTQIPEYLSPQQFKVDDAIVINDNDLAFASKIDIIRNAKKELRLIYYIYDLDETTAYMTNEIIKRVTAEPDFKVKLLTDYQYNYKNLDFYRWLEKQQPHGKQQIEVRFYNRPNREVIKFAEFMTLGCGTAGSQDQSIQCTEDKLAYLKKYDTMTLSEAEDAMSEEAKIFLAGFYAKDPNGIQFGTQLGYARDLNTILASPDGAPSMTESQKESLKKVMSLYWSSKTGNTAQRIGAQVQLSIAGLFFGEELKPFLNTLETVLPFSVKDAQNTTLMTSPQINYITDYTHHKFILGDTDLLQIGGRNCANAYHMRPNELEKKYIFMDTDLFMDVEAQSGKFFKHRFEELWNFTDMVATTSDIAKHAPIGYLYLINQANTIAKTACASLSDPVQQMACAGEIFYKLLDPGYGDLVIAEQQEFGERFQNYLTAYEVNYLSKKTATKPWTRLASLFDSENGYIQEVSSESPLHNLDAISVNDGELYYLENVPFDLSQQRGRDKLRSFGASYGEEITHGKMIHKVWEEAFEAACAKSNKDNTPIEVIIHQGYFAPTEGMVLEMNRLMNERICPNVTLKLYTNSITTTDLTPINFIGRRQLYAMLQKNTTFNTAKFEYYEYDKIALEKAVVDNFTPEDGSKASGSYSLHSKVIIFDDDIYIGSANAEFRSYMMDTNNGVFIKDAPSLVASYKQMLDTMKENNFIVDAKSSLQFENLAALRLQEEKDINELRQRYAMDDRSFIQNRKAQFEYTIERLSGILEKVSKEMKKTVRKKKLVGSSKLDELLKVF